MKIQIKRFIIENRRKFSHLIKCIKVLNLVGGIRFYVDMHNYRLNKGKSTLRRVSYHGHRIFYRSMTTDVIVVRDILTGNYHNGEYYRLYEGIERPNATKGILDLGANIGTFAIKYAIFYPNIKIIAVEPEEENYKILQMNVKSFPNIIPVCAGVWSHDTYLKVIARDTGAYGFKVEETNSTDGVEGISIDSLCKKYQVQPDVVKMDIEGSENAIFQHIEGCTWLDNVQTFMVETHDRIIPGTDMLVKKKMKERNFDMIQSGETLIYTKQPKHV